ncbi:MAG: toll/interleukin-1 receptor domain-containing protein, partial [Bryobacteraceae bacterium]
MDVSTPHDLFLSYNRQDSSAVKSFADALRDRGIIPFLDRWYLLPGRSWIETLERELA